MSLSEIQKLSIAERLELVEDIWDSIALDAEVLPLTDEEKKVLDDRLAESSGAAQGSVSWRVAKARIEKDL